MLEVVGLVRTYGPVRALDGMTFAVEPGSVTGFLGPNGDAFDAAHCGRLP